MNASAAKEAIDLGREWARRRAGTGSSATTAPRTSSGCAARSASSTRSRAAAPRSSGGCCTSEDYVAALGALTGSQAVQMVQGRPARRSTSPAGRSRPTRNLAGADLPRPEPLPGEQRARGGAPASTTRSLRADQIDVGRGRRRRSTGSRRSSPTPRPASAAPLNAFELMKAMIEAGAAGVHFEDQLASEKKCGHLGGKVLVPTAPVHPDADRGAPRRRRARRPDAARRPHRRRRGDAAHERRRRARPPVPHRRAHRRGLLPRPRRARGGDRARARLRAVRRPHLDARPSTPDLGEAREFAEAIHAEFPGKLLAYNCSPSFNWKRHLDDDDDRARSSASSARWATASSSSRSPASTRSTTSMFELAQGYARRGHDRLRRAAGARVRARGATATPRRATSARSAPATSTRSRRPSPAARARRSRSRARPRRRSSSGNGAAHR